MIMFIFRTKKASNKSDLYWIIYRFSWLDKRIKKVTINAFSKKYNKYFQYPVIVALNHEGIKKTPQTITKMNHL